MSELQVREIIRHAMKGYIPLTALFIIISVVASAATIYATTIDTISTHGKDILDLKTRVKVDEEFSQRVDRNIIRIGIQTHTPDLERPTIQ